jgi:hypothetical protein
LVILLASLQCSPIYAETFTGKVVDDKGTPIVDAVVVGIWQEVRDFITGGFTRIKDVKETTTDTDGVWFLKGPSGAQSNSGLGDFLGIVSFVTGIHYTLPPHFSIYKPGYCYYGTWSTFVPDACRLKPASYTEGKGETLVLPQLLDPKDRERAIPDPTVDYGERKFEELLSKQPKLLERINEERRHLGLKEVDFHERYRQLPSK